MPYQFLTTEPAVKGGAANTFEKSIPAGNYTYGQLTLTGTTVAGQTLTLADIGTVTLSQGGKQRIRQTFSALNRQANIRGGFAATVSGSAASAERVVTPIYFWFDNLPNSLMIENNNEWKIKVEFNSVMATRFGANAVNVRVDLFEVDDVFQSYVPILLNQDLQATGAGAKNDVLSGVNTVLLYLKDDQNDTNTITVKVDGKTIVGNTPFQILRDGTNLFERVETSGQNMVLVPVGISGERQSTLNQTTEIEADFSAAGTLNVIKGQIEWLPTDQVAQNRSRIDQSLSVRQNRQNG